MQYKVIIRVLGVLLSLFSISMLVPWLVSLYYQDGASDIFLIAFAVTMGAGVMCYIPVGRVRQQVRLRDGFLIVVLFWSVLGTFGGLPLYLSTQLNLTLAQAVFESLSGLSTTGATVIVGLDELPKSILYYRQQMQWLGGMGIIVLAVAVLPMLGIGGMQLYKAETPGPQKDSKLTPRIAETAKWLWVIYMTLTIACALAYWAAGMTLFDAIGHSFSTVAIGGFSTHDASMGYFNSATIEMIAVVFMLLSGVNFALHYYALRNRSLGHYWYDSELKGYLFVLGSVATTTVVYLYFTHTFDVSDSFTRGLFQAVSIGTTTGFTTAEYFNWPGFLPVLLLFTSFVGGCAGSTGGGMKVIRVMLLFKQGTRELTRMLHPHARIVVKIGNNPTPERIQDVVWGFFSAYVAVFVVLMLLLMAAGLDQVTAFSAVAACINNLGPGLGDVGANYASIGDFVLWLLCVGMLLGRLEIFTLLVLFMPAFWRK